MSGRDTEWRDLAAADAADRLKDENPHHENCDTRDTQTGPKPCNCYLHWRASYAEVADANLQLHGDVNQLRNAMKAICNVDTLDDAQDIAGSFVFCNHGKAMTENCPQCREEDIAWWAKLIRRAQDANGGKL